MGYKWTDIPELIRTPIGRMQFAESVYMSGWPVFSRIAAFYRKNVVKSTRIVAVVGSFGKTTTMRAVTAALGGENLSRLYRNSWSFVTRAIFRIRPDDHHAVIEVGISGHGQMDGYADIIRPDITVVTSIGSEHHRSFGTLESTRKEKSKMVKKLPETGIAVLNGDDPNVIWMRGETRARVVTFGINEENDIRASDITLNWPEGTRFKLHAYGQTRDVNIRLIGRHMVYPILAAVAVAVTEGFTLEEILPVLEGLLPTPGRLEPVRLSSGAFILRDDFKSTLETIHTSLDVFLEIPAKRKIIVFGDVSEPPGSQGPIYRSIGERIGNMASSCIFIGGNLQRYASGTLSGGLPRHFLKDAKRSVLKAVELLKDLGPGDVVLIKGRDTQRLDRIALSLSGRKVRCDISFCNTRAARCESCPMLEGGWKGSDVISKNKVVS